MVNFFDFINVKQDNFVKNFGVEKPSEPFYFHALAPRQKVVRKSQMSQNEEGICDSAL